MAVFKDTLNRWSFPVMMLASCIAVLIIGVPRLLHELMLTPGNPILEKINNALPVSNDDLVILEQSRLDALYYWPTPKTQLELGAAYLARALQETKAEARKKFAMKANNEMMAGLKKQPLNAFAWLRVAAANTLMGRDRYVKALQAWRKSIATARVEPFLSLSRFHLGTILHEQMDANDIELLHDQIELAFHYDKRKFKNYVIRHKLESWIIYICSPNSEVTKYISYHQ